MGKSYNVGGVKGGTGKSTFAINLAGGLAQQGHSTILLDCDTNKTCLRYMQRRKSLIERLKDGDLSYYESRIKSVIKQSIRAWGGLEEFISSIPYIECAGKEPDDNLRTDIAELTKKYDFVIIDTGGFENRAFITAASYSDMTVIPIQPSQLDIEQLPKLGQAIINIEEQARSVPTFEDWYIDARVLLNQVEKQKKGKNNTTKTVLKGVSKWASVMSAHMPRNETFQKYAEIGLTAHDGKDQVRSAIEIIIQELNDERLPATAKILPNQEIA